MQGCRDKRKKVGRQDDKKKQGSGDAEMKGYGRLHASLQTRLRL